MSLFDGTLQANLDILVRQKLTKPFDVEELRLILDKATERAALVREAEQLRSEVGRRYQIENIVGRSARMQVCGKAAISLASADCRQVPSGAPLHRR